MTTQCHPDSSEFQTASHSPVLYHNRSAWHPCWPLQSTFTLNTSNSFSATPRTSDLVDVYLEFHLPTIWQLSRSLLRSVWVMTCFPFLLSMWKQLPQKHTCRKSLRQISSFAFPKTSDSHRQHSLTSAMSLMCAAPPFCSSSVFVDRFYRAVGVYTVSETESWLHNEIRSHADNHTFCELRVFRVIKCIK